MSAVAQGGRRTYAGSKKPTLVVFDPIGAYYRRYCPKVTGGFFTETFEIVDEENAYGPGQAAAVEVLRTGGFRGQENINDFNYLPERA